jgi:hypothetical protein
MATLPVATGARILGIHPKTLHHWLAKANVPLAPHPSDARIKCVGEEHLREVARRHSRPLPDLPSALLLNACAAPGSRAQPAQLSPTNEADPDHPIASSASEADLLQRLSCLETKFMTRESAPCSARSGTAARAGAHGRASHLGPGIAHTLVGGRAAA